jgi:hypothetical protein
MKKRKRKKEECERNTRYKWKIERKEGRYNRGEAWPRG